MIRGRHIGLRAIEADDLQQLLVWRNQPDFRRYFREYRELSNTHQQQWYDSKVLNDPSTRMFSIVDAGGGKLLGACGLCYIDWINQTADFSIYIGHDHLYIDEVYAVDAGIQLLKYGFEELGLHRIWCEIYDFDEAKKKFLPRLGFTLDGRHRQTHWAEGAWHDSLFYGVLIDEFSQEQIEARPPGTP
jgi:RimJ/RimL family protein N-acetyltransferase